MARTRAQQQLVWRDVSAEAKRGGGPAVLRNASGHVSSGQVLCLLGPSGAGKTTLLQILAGCLLRRSGLLVTGRVWNPFVPPGAASPLVHQSDVLFSYLTVRQTLQVAAILRGVAPSEVDTRVASVLQRTNLVAVGGSVVGSEAGRGRRISGGERKRLAIGCELVAEAGSGCLFLDEPTSGLDSFQALRVMETLQGLAATGLTVVLSLHQPSGALLSQCDQLLLLASGGRTVFQGPPGTVGEYFSEVQARVSLPRRSGSLVSDIEWALEVSSVDQTSAAAVVASEKVVQGLSESWTEANAVPHTPPSAAVGTGVATLPRGAWQWIRAWRCLAWRAWKQAAASPVLLVMRLVANLVTACIFGAIFFQLPNTTVSIPGRKGLANVLCNFASMTSMVKTLGVFRSEAVIVERERSQGLIPIAAYYSSKVLAELPLALLSVGLLGGLTFALTHPTEATEASCVPGIPKGGVFLAVLVLQWQVGTALGLFLGAALPTVDAALEIGKMVTMVFIVFGGLYFNTDTLPAVLQWLPAVSPVKRAWEALVVNDFAGRSLEGARGTSAVSGDHVLAELGLPAPASALAQSVAALLLAAVGFHVLAFASLAMRRPRFAVPVPVPPGSASSTPAAAAVAAEAGSGGHLNLRSGRGRGSSGKQGRRASDKKGKKAE